MASYFCIPPPVQTRDRVTVRRDQERGEEENRGEEVGREGGKNTLNPNVSSLFSGDFKFSVTDLRGTNKLK